MKTGLWFYGVGSNKLVFYVSIWQLILYFAFICHEKWPDTSTIVNDHLDNMYMLKRI